MLEFEDPPPQLDPNRSIDARRTLFKAVAVLIGLAIAVGGMAYAGHDIWTNFTK